MKCAVVLLSLLIAVQGGRILNRYKHWSVEDVVTSNAKFATELYESLSRSDQHQHMGLMSSPFGIHLALSVLFQGARGDTEKLLEQKLHASGSSFVGLGYSEILQNIHNAQDVEFVIANKVYINDQKHITEGFNFSVVDEFRSEVESIDFTQKPTAVDTITTWVNDKTNQKISPNDLWKHAVTETADMILANAVYFKGQWLHPFVTLPECTHTFTHKGEDGPVPGMSVIANFNYKKDADLDAEVIEIPYTNEEYSMILVLPTERDGISDLENKVVNSDLTQILEGVSLKKVSLVVPKFGLEYGLYLERILTEIGFGNIFEAEADFSGLVEDGNSHVTNFIHITSIRLDENGTDAATDVVLPGPSGQVRSDLPTDGELTFLNADHPFMFFVVRKETSLSSKINVLLYGKIINLQSNCPL